MASMKAVTAALVLAAMLASGCEGESPSGAEAKPETGGSADAGRKDAGVTGDAKEVREGKGARSGPTVQVPQPVREGWSAVRLRIGDGKGNKEAIRVPLGETVRLDRPELSLEAAHFLPAYMSDGSRITSQSNEPENPAALITVWRGDSQVDKGWVFKDLPQFNTFKGEVVDVELVAGERSTEDKE